MEAPVYSFFQGDFPDVEFFDLQHYINVVEEDTDEVVFDPAEAPACERACERAAVQPIHGAEAENQIDGSNEEVNLPVLP